MPESLKDRADRIATETGLDPAWVLKLIEKQRAREPKAKALRIASVTGLDPRTVQKFFAGERVSQRARDLIRVADQIPDSAT